MSPQALVLTAGEVAAAVGGRLLWGSADFEIRGFSIDTRTLEPGDLFFAIRGDRFNGEQFVSAALEKGASGVITASPMAPSHRLDGAFVIFAADTTRALQDLARHIRRASGARVVAITGSAGKTTTKEATADFLATRYQVFRNRGNLNNHIGLPLSLLDLRRRPDVAVVELGMSHAGETRLLTSIAEPDVRVWTNVGEAHLEFFASVDAIADAKAEMLENATPATVLVANRDDARVMARVAPFPGHVVTFGFSHDADVRATDVQDLGIEGTTANVHTSGGTAELHTPLLGRANLANVLAAVAVARHFEVPLPDIAGRAAGLRAAPRRGEVLKLAGGVTLVDDSYNSNPSALMRSLEVVGRESSYMRRVAVIGEMLELGGRSVSLHEDCGRAAARSGFDALLAIGGKPAKALAAAAIDAGMKPDAVSSEATSEDAAATVRLFVRPGDVVLVKGSRGIRTDVVADRLKAEFA